VEWEYGFCHDNIGHDSMYLNGRSRCLPDTAHPAYQWGFSTMMTAVVVIMQFIWGLTMYSIWQDAQFNSKLVKTGFKMTQFRAAFALAATAENRTELASSELVRAEQKSLEAELTGKRKNKGAVIDYEIFGDGEPTTPRFPRKRHTFPIQTA
jgi:hypothetical protein